MTSTSSSPRADFTLQVNAAPLTPVTVTWQYLTVTSESSKHNPKDASDQAEEVRLLDNVSGIARPGELLAIVGSTSTVLLECLAQHRRATSGTITLSVPTQDLSIGMVAKEPLLLRSLTVHDHLLFQSELRMSKATAYEERCGRVVEVADELGLLDVLSTKIGALPVDKRKLVAVAAELLSNPPVILLDEPMADMDTFMAEQVGQHLQRLARAGRTIIATMTGSTPSFVFPFVDQLHLLANGQLVFKGRATESLTYLETLGVRCPSFMNPFEFFDHVITDYQRAEDTGSSTLKQLTDGTSSTLTSTRLDALDDCCLPHRRPLWTTQLSVLFRRNVVATLLNRKAIQARLAAMIFLMLLVGLVYIRLDLVQRDIQPFASACFFMSVTQFLYTALPELLGMPGEVAIALDEHNKGLYHALNWYLIKNISELPLHLLYPMVFLVPTYFMVGFTVDTKTFFTFYLFIVLVVSTATGVAYFFSCVTSSRNAAMKFSLVFLSPALVFGGAFVTRKTTPVYFVWLQQLSPIKYCYHGLMRAFWKTVPTIYCAPGTPCRATSGLQVLMLNVVKPDTFLSDVLLLLAIDIAFRILGGIALAVRARAIPRAQ